MKKMYGIALGLLVTLGSFAQPSFTWAKQLGGSSSDFANAITVDGAGNVYSSGWFSGTCDLDPSASVSNITSFGSTDIFISKLNANGNFIWGKQLGGSSAEQCWSIAVDALGNVYTAGSFVGTADFDPSAGVFNMTALGANDIFICKLDASGNFVWAKQLSGTGNEVANAMCLDASGNVYTTGRFSGAATDFDPSTATFTMTSAGLDDVFISKLDASGNFIWAKQLGGFQTDNALSISIDNSGNVITAGNFNGTADFDPGAGVFTLTPVGGVDVFINKINTAGNFVWTMQFGGTVQDQVNSVITDNIGNIYTTGNFMGTCDFDPSAAVLNLTSFGNNDIFVHKLDANGNLVWAKQLGGATNDAAYSIKVNNSNEVFTTGYIGGTADFDPGAGVFNITPNGGFDVFVSKLNAAGNFAWAVKLGGTATDVGTKLDVDAYGSVYTTGYFNTTSDFDPGAPVFNLTSFGVDDSFVHKMGDCAAAPAMPSAIIGNVSICVSSLNTYSIAAVAGAAYYNWSLPAAWTGNSTTNVITTTANSASGNITVTANNACGASIAQVLSVTVSPTPTITALTNNTLICIGQVASLTASGATNYTWNPGGMGSSINVSPTVTTTYTLTGTNSGGCSNSIVFTQSVSTCAELNVIVSTKTEISIYPNPTSGVVTISGAEGKTVSVYNVLGVLVHTELCTATAYCQLDLSQQSKGIYFVKVGLVTKKIIKE
jgi:uncharacterized membrane protein YqhA